MRNHNPVHMPGDVDLVLVVRMNLDQYFDTQLVRLDRSPCNEVERLWDHETAGAGFLDRVARGIQANRPNSSGLKLTQDLFPGTRPCGRADVDIDLLRRERGPQETSPCLHPAGPS